MWDTDPGALIQWDVPLCNLVIKFVLILKLCMFPLQVKSEEEKVTSFFFSLFLFFFSGPTIQEVWAPPLPFYSSASTSTLHNVSQINNSHHYYAILYIVFPSNLRKRKFWGSLSRWSRRKLHKQYILLTWDSNPQHNSLLCLSLHWSILYLHTAALVSFIFHI
jgi:hypothetical protein